jgi:hypothetical protein
MYQKLGNFTFSMCLIYPILMMPVPGHPGALFPLGPGLENVLGNDCVNKVLLHASSIGNN